MPPTLLTVQFLSLCPRGTQKILSQALNGFLYISHGDMLRGDENVIFIKLFFIVKTSLFPDPWKTASTYQKGDSALWLHSLHALRLQAPLCPPTNQPPQLLVLDRLLSGEQVSLPPRG